MRIPLSSMVALAIISLSTWANAGEEARQETVGKPEAAPQQTDATPVQHGKGHSHERSMLHDGQVAMTKQHHFETVFGPDGIRIYVYDRDQTPMQVGTAMGTVAIESSDGSSRELTLVRAEPKNGELTAYFCPAHPEQTKMEPGICTQCGTMQLMAQDHLFAAIDFNGTELEGAKAVVLLKGLDGEESEASFTATVAMASSEEHHEQGVHEGHSH